MIPFALEILVIQMQTQFQMKKELQNFKSNIQEEISELSLFNFTYFFARNMFATSVTFDLIISSVGNLY